MPNNKNAKRTHRKNVSGKKPSLKKVKMVTKTYTTPASLGRGFGTKTVTKPAKRKPKSKKIKRK